MDWQLTNKKVLITACTGGIGKQIAKQFADEGAIVIINGRNKESAEKILAKFKQQNKTAYLALGDVATKEGINDIIKCVADLGGVDILVNNAGIYINHDWFNSTADDWMKLYAVNVASVVNLVQAFIPHMKKISGEE